MDPVRPGVIKQTFSGAGLAQYLKVLMFSVDCSPYFRNIQNTLPDAWKKHVLPLVQFKIYNFHILYMFAFLINELPSEQIEGMFSGN